MRCIDCRWFNKENEFCMKDGGSVFGATIDDECEYADNMTVFDRITASPEMLAPKLVFILSPGLFTSHIIDTVHESWKDAYAATVARLKEQAQ